LLTLQDSRRRIPALTGRELVPAPWLAPSGLQFNQNLGKVLKCYERFKLSVSIDVLKAQRPNDRAKSRVIHRGRSEGIPKSIPQRSPLWVTREQQTLFKA
jgi:hypothetical protein